MGGSFFRSGNRGESEPSGDLTSSGSDGGGGAPNWIKRKVRDGVREIDEDGIFSEVYNKILIGQMRCLQGQMI